MICEPCKAAGLMVRDGKPATSAFLHSHCHDPKTCPCQHRTGVYVAPVSQVSKIVR